MEAGEVSFYRGVRRAVGMVMSKIKMMLQRGRSMGEGRDGLSRSWRTSRCPWRREWGSGSVG